MRENGSMMQMKVKVPINLLMGLYIVETLNVAKGMKME